jgi:hypothetical protein
MSEVFVSSLLLVEPERLQNTAVSKNLSLFKLMLGNIQQSLLKRVSIIEGIEPTVFEPKS